MFVDVPLVMTRGVARAKVDVVLALLLETGLSLTGLCATPPAFKVSVLTLLVVEARTAIEVTRTSSPEFVASNCQLPNRTCWELVMTVLSVGTEFLVTVKFAAFTVCCEAEVLEAGDGVTV